MSTAQTAVRRTGWRVLAAAPAMIGSLLMLVFLSGGLQPWGPIVVLAWMCIGLLILTRPGEAVAARLLCRFRRPAPAQAVSLSPVLRTVLDRCGLNPGAIDLYVVRGTDRNAYATGKRSIALTTRLVADHGRGAVSDRALGSMLCHEVGHLVTRSVRLALVTTWFAKPWRSTYRFGARIVLPIAARQPRSLLALVVVSVFTIAIAQGFHEHQWGSVAVLAGIVISVFVAPAIDAAASRAEEYAADQFAALAGYGDDLSRTLADIDSADGILSPRSRVLGLHPGTARRVQRLRQTAETLTSPV
jgi:Zn-dependent protease with chaperone function